MKKKYLLLSIILILTIFNLPYNVAGANVEAGQKVFYEICNKCHPGTYYDNPSLLSLSRVPENLVRKAVRNGVQGHETEMPFFTVNELNESDLDNVIAYIKSSSSTPTVPPTPLPNNLRSVETPTKASGFDVFLSIPGILLIYLYVVNVTGFKNR